MDKNNLYYIVVKETNRRNRNKSGESTIMSLEVAAPRAEQDTALGFDEYEAISISDYEETYSDTKPETAKSSIWEEFYWKEKFKAAEHESSYWFKRKEREGRKS